MVEGVNKASRPGASAIGRRLRFTRLFHSSSVISGVLAFEDWGRLKSVTRWLRQQNAMDVKESSLVGDCCYPSRLCPDGHLWAMFRAT